MPRTWRVGPMSSPLQVLRAFLSLRCFCVLALSGLASCGGGGGGGGSAPPPLPPSNSSGITWTPGVFQPSSRFENQCASPRLGIHPGTGLPYPDLPGSTLTENHWLRSWTNELYLWYDEVVDRNPASYSTAQYFDLLRTEATTPAGTPKDRFHFTYPTEVWESLSQSGVVAGYGAQWIVLESRPPRRIVVAYTEPNSPASSVNLMRGAEVLAVDGVDVVSDNTQAGVDVLNAGLFPEQPGESHTFVVQDPGTGNTRSLTMVSVNVTIAPVQNVNVFQSPFGPVGYLVFSDHIQTAEAALIDAVNTLKAANITDLILDIRYNSGGYLDIADELAYMIAGPGPTAGRTFERLVFNDKYPSTNPVTNEPLLPLPFHTTAVGFSVPAGQSLPTLNLPRVIVITGSTTCSASESIINGLRGVDVEVIQIGSTTCGKPYGFYPTDNCGTTYFSIQFRGENDKGFGHYGDGFSPENTQGPRGETLPGCSVGDDFARALGDPQERRLAAALQYQRGDGCPAPSGFGVQPQWLSGTPERANVDGVMGKLPWLENRILRQVR